jgi:hypothetical protein
MKKMQTGGFSKQINYDTIAPLTYLNNLLTMKNTIQKIEKAQEIMFEALAASYWTKKSK